jgi:hypothetical protein
MIHYVLTRRLNKKFAVIHDVSVFASEDFVLAKKVEAHLKSLYPTWVVSLDVGCSGSWEHLRDKPAATVTSEEI